MSEFLSPELIKDLLRLARVGSPDQWIVNRLHTDLEIRNAWNAMVTLLTESYEQKRQKDLLEAQNETLPDPPAEVVMPPQPGDSGAEEESPLQAEDSIPIHVNRPVADVTDVDTMPADPAISEPPPAESEVAESEVAESEVAESEVAEDAADPAEPAATEIPVIARPEPLTPEPPAQVAEGAEAGATVEGATEQAAAPPAPGVAQPVVAAPPTPTAPGPGLGQARVGHGLPNTGSGTGRGDVPLAKPAPSPIMRDKIRLPNGSVGKDYKEDLVALLELDPGTKINLHKEWPEGLDLDPEGILQGTPVAAAELKMAWRASSGGNDIHGTVQLTINPDPRSLWQDKPSDEADPYWKPDRVHDNGQGDNVRVMTASVRGRSHAHVGSCRDDDFAFDLEAIPGCSILAVGDGAGSAKYSRKGSIVACEKAVEVIAAKLKGSEPDQPHPLLTLAREATPEFATKADPEWTAKVNSACYDILATAAFEAARAIKIFAEAEQLKPRECATTLLLGVVVKAAEGWFVATYWVGDGAIAAWDSESQTLSLLCEPDSGQFAGETQFLTGLSFSDSKEIASRMRTRILERFDYLALMTDGISDPWFESEAALQSIDHWTKFSEDIAPVLTAGEADNGAQILLDWMDFWSAGNHDDRTLLLFQPWRRQG